MLIVYSYFIVHSISIEDTLNSRTKDSMNPMIFADFIDFPYFICFHERYLPHRRLNRSAFDANISCGWNQRSMWSPLCRYQRQSKRNYAINFHKFTHIDRQLSTIFQEISFDVFLQVIWEDKRIQHKNDTHSMEYIELKIEERHKFWV